MKLFKKDIFKNKNKANLSEIKRGPKKLTFIRAILTSVISVIITVSICFILFIIGTSLSDKVINLF